MHPHDHAVPDRLAPRPSVAIALLIIVPAVAGCTTGTGNLPTASGPPESAAVIGVPGTSATAAAVGSAAAPDTSDGAPSTNVRPDDVSAEANGATPTIPLLAAVLLAFGLETRDETDWLMSANPSETVVGECMAERGFQYVVVEDRPLEPRLEMPAEEFAARFGFGATMYALELVPLVSDPNVAYRMGLSDAESRAYDEAQRACLETAPPANPAALFPPGSGPAMSVAAEQFSGTVAADARTVNAAESWRSCLAAAGYAFDDPPAMRASINSRVVGLDRQGLEALHDEEVLIATANLACEPAYTAVVREVITDRFAEFEQLYQAALASGAAPEANG